MRGRNGAKSLRCYRLTGRFSQLLLVLLLALHTLPTHAQWLVIAKADSRIPSLSKNEVERIFMKKLKVLPNGTHVTPVGQISNPTVDEPFFKALTGKDRSQLTAYWARLLFTGKDRPPTDGKTNAGVIELVMANPHALGYIEASALTPDVRVVLEIP
jgi:ABC-type phosphate transport system substrate-binding protein